MLIIDRIISRLRNDETRYVDSARAHTGSSEKEEKCVVYRAKG